VTTPQQANTNAEDNYCFLVPQEIESVIVCNVLKDNIYIVLSTNRNFTSMSILPGKTVINFANISHNNYLLFTLYPTIVPQKIQVNYLIYCKNDIPILYQIITQPHYSKKLMMLLSVIKPLNTVLSVDYRKLLSESIDMSMQID